MSKRRLHGGRRPGAGRPQVDAELRFVRRSITMPPDDWQYVEHAGAGNASAGVRELVERDRNKCLDKAKQS